MRGAATRADGPAALRRLQRRSGDDERGRARREEHTADGGGEEHRQQRRRPQPVGLERDEHDERDRERHDGAAAEGEVEGCRERDERHGCHGREGPGATKREPGREGDADDEEKPECVPVADRLCELVAGGRVVGAAHRPREEPCAERIDGDDRDAGDDPGEQRRNARWLEEEHEHGCGAEVDERPLGLQHGHAGPGRPEDREKLPHPEQPECSEHEDVEWADAQLVGDEKHGDRTERERERDKPPLRGEVPPLRKGEHHHQHGRNGSRQDPVPHDVRKRLAEARA